MEWWWLIPIVSGIASFTFVRTTREVLRHREALRLHDMQDPYTTGFEDGLVRAADMLEAGWPRDSTAKAAAEMIRRSAGREST